MAQEIERKFLVRGDDWRYGSNAVYCCQGYLAFEINCTVRVRILGENAYLTIKGKATGLTRPEYEYEIPVDDARELMNFYCLHPLIEKNRHTVMHSGVRWVIDEFLKANYGLILAEVELESEDQQIILPGWAGEEVTDDPRYYNSYLARKPYALWVPGQK